MCVRVCMRACVRACMCMCAYTHGEQIWFLIGTALCKILHSFAILLQISIVVPENIWVGNY